MKKKYIIAIVMAALIILCSFTMIIASERGSFGRQWGEYLSSLNSDGDSNLDSKDESVFATGKDVVILNSTIDQAKQFYILSGYPEQEAFELAIDYSEKYETMYYMAVKSGYKASEEEVDARINELKEMIILLDDQSDFQEHMDSFGTEEDYWEFERSICARDLTIEKYRKAELETEFARISRFDKGSEEYQKEWIEWYENYQTELVKTQKFSITNEKPDYE